MALDLSAEISKCFSEIRRSGSTRKSGTHTEKRAPEGTRLEKAALLLGVRRLGLPAPLAAGRRGLLHRYHKLHLYPGFRRYVERTDLPFGPREEFGRADLDARQDLYRKLAEKIWDPECLEREAAGKT
jgi:hypothetical protein